MKRRGWPATVDLFARDRIDVQVCRLSPIEQKNPSDPYAMRSMESCGAVSRGIDPEAHLSQERCRLALEDLFVTLPDRLDINFRSVFLALDAVHGRTSGRVSSRSFLLTRHSKLGGRAPIDVMAEPDGPELIWRLVDAVAEDFNQSLSAPMRPSLTHIYG
jgi:hypothetical protein